MGPAGTGTHSSAQNISQKSIKKHACSAAAAALGSPLGSGAADREGERQLEREREIKGPSARQSAGDKCPKASKRNVDKAGAALGQGTEDCAELRLQGQGQGQR